MGKNMTPRKASRKGVGRRKHSGPRSPQTILAQARKSNLERALDRRDLFAVAGASPRTNLEDRLKGNRQARKYSKFVVLPSSQEPYEQNCLQKEPILPGYVFVPKGDVYITRHCRSQTKECQQVVYVVYDNTGKRTLGLRVPFEIHTAVLRSAAATADSRANAVQLRDAKDLSRSRELLHIQFPLMPVDSLEIILDHAFLKGSGRVGRTATKTDERKAILAVEAHIRHTHTPYEELMDAGMERKKAREAVWETVQAIKTAWEGGGNQSESLTLR